MAILNPEHLFEQAERLVIAPPHGPPRQVDLRRAISAAYYGLFHLTLTALADEFVGFNHRASSRYAVVYRSVDHSALNRLCEQIKNANPNVSKYLPPSGFGADTTAFATAVFMLQAKRHRADYDPQFRPRTSDARLDISTARSAAHRFSSVATDDRKMFLTLLLLPKRRD